MAGTDEKGGPSPKKDPAAPASAEAKPKTPRARKAAGGVSNDPEQLAAEIERTREELAVTLDAIADKVSPKRVAKRTTKKVATAVKDTAHDAAVSVKDTAVHAKEKVTGATPAAPVAAAPSPAPATSYLDTGSVPTGSGIKPKYVAAAAAAALVVWLLLRGRK